MGEAVKYFCVADHAFPGQVVGQVRDQLRLAQLLLLLEGLHDGVECVESLPLQPVQIVHQSLGPHHALSPPPLLLHEHFADQDEPGGHVEPLPEGIIVLRREVGSGFH